jgi:hypothetical protein
VIPYFLYYFHAVSPDTMDMEPVLDQVGERYLKTNTHAKSKMAQLTWSLFLASALPAAATTSHDSANAVREQHKQYPVQHPF